MKKKQFKVGDVVNYQYTPKRMLRCMVMKSEYHGKSGGPFGGPATWVHTLFVPTGRKGGGKTERVSEEILVELNPHPFSNFPYPAL